MIINQNINIVGFVESQQKEIDSMPVGISKGIGYGKAMILFHQYPTVVQVLKKISDDIGKSGLSITVKVTQTKISKTVCIPGWHIDTVRNFLDPRPLETHYLWVSHTGTEFLTNEIKLDETLGIIDFYDVVKDIKEEKIFKCTPNTIVKYNRLNLHRGCPSESNEKRLLIRVSKE